MFDFEQYLEWICAKEIILQSRGFSVEISQCHERDHRSHRIAIENERVFATLTVYDRGDTIMGMIDIRDTQIAIDRGDVVLHDDWIDVLTYTFFDLVDRIDLR
ncbi:MAG: hypothetical protein K2W85_02720 [Phycisphaerales bacterium]|nr:hypothetical protein [Phycisphaerales bacterium]